MPQNKHLKTGKSYKIRPKLATKNTLRSRIGLLKKARSGHAKKGFMAVSSLRDSHKALSSIQVFLTLILYFDTYIASSLALSSNRAKAIPCRISKRTHKKSTVSLLFAKHLEDSLWYRICLCKYRKGTLHQSLIAYKFSHFAREINI